eukprot:753491-Hanusia_phi.AAC.5
MQVRTLFLPRPYPAALQLTRFRQTRALPARSLRWVTTIVQARGERKCKGEPDIMTPCGQVKSLPRGWCLGYGCKRRSDREDFKVILLLLLLPLHLYCYYHHLNHLLASPPPPCFSSNALSSPAAVEVAIIFLFVFSSPPSLASCLEAIHSQDIQVIHGERCNVIAVDANLVTVDISHVPGMVSPGDEVIILGCDGHQKNVCVLPTLSTRIPTHLPRFYV